MFNNDDPKTNGEYLFYTTIKNKINVIFDVGCRSDTEFITFNGEVHYFDPIESFINNLSKQPNNNKNAYFNNIALGSENTEIYYYLRYQSFYNRINSCNIDDDINKIVVNVKKAKDYIIEKNIKNIDFLKIDTEGYEFNVIKGFEEYIKNVKIIQFEYGGTYLDNNIKLIDVIDYLKERGFINFSYLTNYGIEPIDNFNDHYQYCNIVCINKNMNCELKDYYKSYSKPIVSVNIMGGLGNQMFQIATAYAYAQKYNGKLELLKDKKSNDGRNTYWESILFRCKPYLVESLPDTLSQYSEKCATQFDDIINLPLNGIFLNGYYQSPKYFNEQFKSQIKDLFKPSTILLSHVTEKYKELIKNRDNIVFVHARRTDYTINQHMIDIHNPLSIEYYINATNYVSNIIENPIYVLISDDIQFWKDNITSIPKFTIDNTIFIENESDINTLCLMQQFHHFIIANSTFSWWGAWLANSKNIIAPKKWFGPNGPQNYDDIYEQIWVRC